MSQICVSIGRTRNSAMREQHVALAEDGAKLVELRLDYLKATPDIPGLLRDRPTPVVMTCRRKVDRGRFRGEEDERIALLKQAIVGGADYVDLEGEIAKTVRRFGSTKRIISYHNFRETPANLDAIHAELASLDADMVKMATTACTPSDAVRMLDLVKRKSAAGMPTIGFCMEECGVFSRVLCGKYGSPFTYATFSEERVLAPGQLTYREMRDRFRYESIGPKTAVFAVVGDPIMQSYSPHIHNAALEATGLDAVYVPVLVPSDAFEESMKALEPLRFGGFSVTIPHKKSAADYAAFSDQTVEEAGVSNTLYRDDKLRWHATNTDLPAALGTLRDALRDGESFRGKQVLLLGAGGVATAIAMGLAKAGALLTISNRNKKRGKALAERLGCQFKSWEARSTVRCDILINGTPIGMFPDTEKTPFPGNWMQDGMTVFDTIYNPENTLLIKEARERNCRIASGLEMFVRQAADQFECFTRQPPPMDVMRQTLRTAINPVRLN